jgi:hypothetical protein
LEKRGTARSSAAAPTATSTAPTAAPTTTKPKSKAPASALPAPVTEVSPGAGDEAHRVLSIEVICFPPYLGSFQRVSPYYQPLIDHISVCIPASPLLLGVAKKNIFWSLTVLVDNWVLLYVLSFKARNKTKVRENDFKV